MALNERHPGVPRKPKSRPGPQRTFKRHWQTRDSIQQPSPTARLATLVKRYVDTEAEIVLEKSLAIRVRIVDVRKTYGRTEFLIEPIVGSGELWVTHRRLLLVDPEEDL